MSKKSPENRFQGLMGSLGKAPSQIATDTDAASEPSTAPIAKSKSKDYQRTTVYLPKALHRRLKAAALTEDREISDIIETLVSEYLST